MQCSARVAARFSTTDNRQRQCISRFKLSVILLIVAAALVANPALSRTAVSKHMTSLQQNSFAADIQDLAWCVARHDIGAFVFALSNDGMFGSPWLSAINNNCLNQPLGRGTRYPRGSQQGYGCQGAIWVGATLGSDTLVSTAYDGWVLSTGNEFFPDEAPFGYIKERSSIGENGQTDEDAVSEQDLILYCTDTLIFPYDEPDYLDHRYHKPLGVKLYQESYAWSYPYADDFIICNLTINNVGKQHLRDTYIGLYVSGSVNSSYPIGNQWYYGPWDDDLIGFLREHPTSYHGCDWIDTVNLAWYADNDGNFFTEDELLEPVPAIAAIRPLGIPGKSTRMSYNWWSNNDKPSLNWGPQTRKMSRNLGGGALGTPMGDRNKYFILSNGEHDYDQVYTASVTPGNQVWMYPNQAVAEDISDGKSIDFVLSFGPFDLSPGQSLPIAFAFVMGKNFHRDPYNAQKYLIDYYDPDRYYENVDFSDIVTNAVWASWVYDNPGYDTDGDGYLGKYRVCCEDSLIVEVDSSSWPPDTVWSYDLCEKVYYEGDGVPDYRAAAPPPPPKVWIEPEPGRIRVRFNGTYSETTKDIFLQKIDFEGYRVYYSRDSRESSYSLLVSYDREDYDKFVWSNTRGEWELTDIPLSLDDCRCRYATSCTDSGFHPLDYPRSRPYRMSGFPDSIFYFAPHDYNQSDFGHTAPIRKVYPDQPYPSTFVPDSADVSELTDDGYLKYFEYEFTIDNLLPTVPYYVNVTAFDFGSPAAGLSALESSKTLRSQLVYATSNAQSVSDRNLKTYVYPNPYRGDGDYYRKGFEGRDARWYIPDRLRRIHFANLPARCTISIFSLDGDLVREWEHDMDPNEPASSHDEWDLISRNTQRVVSGIYYWTVAEPDGKTQIGKLVIIK